MQTIKNEFNERKREIETYINFLHGLEGEETKIFSSLTKYPLIIDKTTLQTTLKATIILLLYNLVESMLTKCLSKIHQMICDNSIMYHQLNDCIRKVILTYYANIIYKRGSPTNSVENIFELIEMIQQRKNPNISYKKLTMHYPLYSGNLDTRKIKSVLMKYGISFNESVNELHDIEVKRNILAHGELSFEEVGRDISLQRADILKARTFFCMEKMIECIEEFVTQQNYLMQESNVTREQ